jgi:hypothetical protein
MFCICICMIELNLKNKSKQLEINSNQKSTTRNAKPNSTGRNFLIRDWNSALYPPLETLQNSLGFSYSMLPQILFGRGIKVQCCPDSSICPKLTPPPSFSDHTSWTVSRVRVYLCLQERSQNSLSPSYCVFFLILFQSQSAEFCKFVVSWKQSLS